MWVIVQEHKLGGPVFVYGPFTTEGEADQEIAKLEPELINAFGTDWRQWVWLTPTEVESPLDMQKLAQNR